jgi:hypothetical protein
MYQIVLTENKKKVKVLYEYKRHRDAKWRMDYIKGKDVTFPKQRIWREKKLTPIKYEVLMLKKREEGDISLAGNLDDDEWVLMDVTDYLEEEQFFVTGANRKLEAHEIIDNVILPRLSDKNPKQIVILNNKIVVEGMALNVITCKDIHETVRLYNHFREFSFQEGLSDLAFMGSVKDIKLKKTWYKKILERFPKIDVNRLYRKSGR